MQRVQLKTILTKTVSNPKVPFAVASGTGKRTDFIKKALRQ